MTSPRQSQAQHIIITARCFKSNPYSGLTQTARRQETHQPTAPVNCYEDLLDILGIQISCIFTAYEKVQKIPTMMGHQNFTHVQSPKKGNAGMMGKLKVFIV